MSQVALVTGASRGIGRAIALALASRGFQVACLARDLEQLEHTVHACEAVGGVAIAIPVDLADTARVERELERVYEAFGGVDVLVNNAGILESGPIHEVDPERSRRVMEVNLLSVMHLTSQVSKKMVEAEAGAIINIASIAGKLSSGGGHSYTASKHGMVGFSGAVFEDLRSFGIKVCAICPGFVNTGMVNATPGLSPQRMIQPGDIADAVLFVLDCSDHVCPTEIILRPQRSPRV